MSGRTDLTTKSRIVARMSFCLAALLALAASDAAHAAPASRTHPVMIDAFGRWTLNRLGLPALDVPTGGARGRVSVPYRLPSAARQGPENWYLINLHFRLTIARKSHLGLVYLDGLTNGRAAAQIKFGVYRGRAGALRTVWSTVDYIHGRIEHRTRSRTIEGRFENYLQLKGVHPGRNVLTIELERYGRVEVESLRIFRDSGITYTPVSPAKLRLHLTLPKKKVYAGDTFAIPFRVTNDGDRIARDVVIDASYPHDALRRIDDSRDRFPTLDAPVGGKLRFRARRVGAFRLAVFVRSSANSPGSLIEVSVEAPPAEVGPWADFGRGAGAALLLLGIVLLVAGRRRARARAGRSPLAGFGYSPATRTRER